ncbi:hypothetical protein KCP75_22215 [Salmonella enterica subsp. enterica]|nr:hypothetical protein KCP75_22215 [Salmonella enterica subsp. enterica]
MAVLTRYEHKNPQNVRHRDEDAPGLPLNSYWSQREGERTEAGMLRFQYSRGSAGTLKRVDLRQWLCTDLRSDEDADGGNL